MRYDNNRASLWVIEARPDLAVEDIVDALELPQIVPVLNLSGVVDDDELRADARYATLNGYATHATTGCRDEIVELALRDPRLEHATKPTGLHDLPNRKRNLFSKRLGV